MKKSNLQLIQDFIEASNSSNSNTDKLNVLKTYTEYPVVCSALLYTYDPYKQYYVTSKNCKKRSDIVGAPGQYFDLFDLLDDLNNRVITGHVGIGAVNQFVSENQEFEDIIFNIIDGNLKTRSTASMINKVVPGLIPTFDVALAEAYNAKTKKKVNWDDGWYVSRKLDGVRCICIIDENSDAKFYSRAGNEFKTLGKIAEVIKASGAKNVILDGEVCILDEKGDEDFQSIIKEIGRKNHTIEFPRLITFDILTPDNFDTGTSRNILGKRYEALDAFMDIYMKSFNNHISMTYQEIVEDDKQLEDQIAKANKYGWEGLMIRKNDIYKGKRSSDILKIKSFVDDEYIVVAVENSINRVIVEGKEVEEMMLKNIIIEHKGSKVHVGSGFSHEQRRHYFLNPNDIVGKTVTVQYFEATENQEGGYSLRFPVIKAIYETKRDF